MISITATSSQPIPALRSAFAHASGFPCSIRCGSTPARPNATKRARGSSPSLEDARSLYDLFGLEWTLLALRSHASVEAPDLQVVNLKHDALRELYGADFALIRPDQVVAWRGASVEEALRALEKLRG